MLPSRKGLREHSGTRISLLRVREEAMRRVNRRRSPDERLAVMAELQHDAKEASSRARDRIDLQYLPTVE